MVKYGIHYILWQNNLISMIWKIVVLIEHWASNVAITEFWPWSLLWLLVFKVKLLNSIDHIHGIDRGFSRSNLEIAISQEWEGDWHRTRDMIQSFMTMNVNFCDQVEVQRSFPIVTRVISDIGVPSTRLIISLVAWNYLSIPKLQRCSHWSQGIDEY